MHNEQCQRYAHDILYYPKAQLQRSYIVVYKQQSDRNSE